MKDRRASLLRDRSGGEQSRVTFVELFFDLVFVFAVTQLSHLLLEHLTFPGAFETLLLFLAVWWVWVYTSWITNWLDPQKTPVRVMLFVLMFAGLVLSTSIPEAFGASGLTFALAYVFMQVGRTLFMLWAIGSERPNYTRNFQRVIVWLGLSGVIWIAGGVVDGETRVAFWMLAVAIEYLSPACRFFVPGLGRSDLSDWDIDGAHLAERCALFIIIALGESILVTGVTFADLESSHDAAAAFAVAFVGSVAMWWVYFDTGVERGVERITHSSSPGRLARGVYTYIHLLIGAGIIVTAVGDEFVLVHPTGHIELAAAAVIVGGPALYLLGNLLFKRAIAGRLPLSHLVGFGLLAMIAPTVPYLSPLALAAAVTLSLLVVATWETISLRHAARPPVID
jgi:low temperature requirement protein LtrA